MMETLSTNQAIKPIVNILKLTYGIVPIVAGLDKFTDLLTHWENYLHPGIAGMLPFEPHTFMMIVGVIEIIAGIIVLAKPAIGGLYSDCMVNLNCAYTFSKRQLSGCGSKRPCNGN